MNPKIISGIQPTGELHLGNYLGALKNFVDLQNSNQYECYFFIADLHSLTETYSPKEKTEQILDLASSFLAAGVDPKKSLVFLQSSVPAHAELAWILNTITPMGELQRMTQFKDKSILATQKSVNVGLFSYPVLMTADILLYDANFVPVGEDQLQHLELTRTLARKFNSKFGKTFIEPKPLLTEMPRIMSLDNPNKKMSKSRPAGCLFLNDSPNAIKQKIKTAVTDSGKEIKFDQKKKPAISNLILIYAGLSNLETREVETKFRNKSYSEFKNELADRIIVSLEPFQERKKEVSRDLNSIKKILKNGQEKASSIAEKKLLEVKEKIGILI